MAETTAARPAGRPRATLTSKLAAVVLALDVFLVFFGALTAWGLGRIDGVAALAGGGAIVLACLLGAGLAMRRQRVAIVIGSAVQAVLIASGLLVTAMYLVGAGSLALWVWCLWRGSRADRQGASA